MRRQITWVTLALAAIPLIACSDGTGPDGDMTGVSLSVTVPSTESAATAAVRAVEETDGVNTLVIDRVAMVLREIELKRQVELDCDRSGSTRDDDGCEEFVIGPIVVELPLDGSLGTVVSADVPPDVYDELEFEVHKPDDDSPEDLAFLQENPEFVDVSVRVEGTFNGIPFVFLQDLNEEQKIDLMPPLVVEQGAGPVNLTMTFDVRGWFRAGAVLFHPESANKGEDNEGLAEENIRRSIELFEDDDRDGRRG